MSVTVGIDFGTHQTKVCIETGEDVRSMQYKFFSFTDLQGTNQLILPSVIQMNLDDTLSYGFIDETQAKKVKIDCLLPEPTKPTLTEPKLVFPKQPQPRKYPSTIEEAKAASNAKNSWKQKIELFKQLTDSGNKNRSKNYNEICAEIDAKNEADYNIWLQTCEQIQDRYNNQMAEYLASKNQYEKDYNTWLEQKNGTRNLVFRYFKQATFANYNWKEDISPTLLSIWYIANLLFDLEEEYPEGFTIQMGVPTGKLNLEKQQRKAAQVVLSAYRLVEQVFKKDKKSFLATTIDQLIELTELVPNSIYHVDLTSLKQEYSILVLPEAYAGLMSVTSRGRLANGMNLMVDFGGGTTDVSFFITAKNQYGVIEPLIHRYYSVSKGINYIVESSFNGTSSELRAKHLTLSSNLLNENAKESAIDTLHKELKEASNEIIKKIYSNFSKTHLSKDKLNAALANRPIIYAGGGSTFEKMKVPLQPFDNVQILGQQHWKGMYIENINEIVDQGLCPILTVALGLSVSKVDDNINICDMNDLFKHLIDSSSEQKRDDMVSDFHDIDD